jgi:hypothetical protein
MSMFSWCCKGRGHELKADELVRMNGCKGAYEHGVPAEKGRKGVLSSLCDD